MKRVHIGIGELHAAREPTNISTILGSCVSVCLYETRKRLGGMNHILLPGNADLDRFNEPARYGINAMELLINSMLSLGASRSDLRAKVFGGGHLLTGNPPVFSPGKENACFVFSFLETENIPVDAYNIGGAFARKVYFSSNTGEVLIKKIRALTDSRILHEEKSYSRELEKEIRKAGRVSLF